MVVAMAHVLDIKPRVIAAEVKTPNQQSDHQKTQSKPHIAGELDLVGETTSEPHYVEVRDGTLLLYPGREPHGPALWRLPLRRLNLQPAASGRPRGFSLSRHGESVPLATFQVGSDVDYERWVKTLAAELMRQTPLDAVRFLDILGITATLSPRSSPLPLRRTHSADSVHVETTPRSCWMTTTCSSIQEEETPNHMLPKSTQSLQRQRKMSTRAPVLPRRNIIINSAKNNQTSSELKSNSKTDNRSCFTDRVDWCSTVKTPVVPRYMKSNSESDCIKQPKDNVKSKNENWEAPSPLPDVVRDLPPCERRSRVRIRGDTPLRSRGLSAEPIFWTPDGTVAELMARCQKDDQYVPVRDKRLLFETLCRRHFVCSTENISLSSTDSGTLAARSRTQSLHDLSQCHNVAVKEMCRYFEQSVPTYNPILKKKIFNDRRQMQRMERRLARARQNLALSEETMWRLQEQAYHKRKS
ncbi:uncharacterized protein LOC142333343 isoform X2 [Lycorma delicatula]|uniref:uncharacterized protein LOC142333343 isoform X2 n=1 Tax=Lycorma delicatula TaxID=130591 RepID=UPI003F516E86